MFLLVLVQPGCPGQNPESYNMVVCVCVCVCVCVWVGGLYSNVAVLVSFMEIHLGFGFQKEEGSKLPFPMTLATGI